jgi:hypothetical protein
MPWGAMKRSPTDERIQSTKPPAAFVWLSRHPRTLAIGSVFTVVIYLFSGNEYVVYVLFHTPYPRQFVPPLILAAVIELLAPFAGARS